MKTTDAICLFLNAKRAKGLSEYTLAVYDYRLQKFARTYPELVTSSSDIEAFLVNAGPSPENRDTYYRLLRNFFGWLHRRRHIKRNPVRDVEPPRLPFKIARSLTRQSLHQLLLYPAHSVPVSAFLYLLADTGLRLSEALSIDITSFVDDTVRVEGKVGEREVPISPRIKQKVMEALPWPWQSAQATSQAIRRAFRHAGLRGKRASAHTLRHTFTRLWEGDESLLVGILGWTTHRMLKIYRPYNVKRAVAQHRRYSPIVNLDGPRQLAML